MERTKLQRGEKEAASGGSYFAAPAKVDFVSSGCALLNCVVGGGWPLGRIVNLVGDKSTGKTLLAIEACTNFARRFPQGRIRYKEVEAAFDPAYAAALGLPLDRVDLSNESPILTVEELFKDMEAFIGKCEKKHEPGCYVVDSLDALSDKAELEGEFGAASYGTAKAKLMSQLFRRLVQHMSRANVLVIIISQVRDNIGITFGKKTTRSGGRALDFYASLVVYLAYIQALKVRRKGVERSVGIEVKAKCEKNKISLPLRDCTFPIMFAYGVDDLRAGIEWLAEVKYLDTLDDPWCGMDPGAIMAAAAKLDDKAFKALRRHVNTKVREAWYAVETTFLPQHRKY